MVIKVSVWKPEFNENATLSMVNTCTCIAINDNHRLWHYKLRMPIFKRFSLIEALVISQILRKFHEKMKFKTYIVGPSRKVNFELYSVILFVWVKCSTFTLKLKKIQDLRWLPKHLMNLSFFTKIFGRSVQLSSRFGRTFSYVREAS